MTVEFQDLPGEDSPSRSRRDRGARVPYSLRLWRRARLSARIPRILRGILSRASSSLTRRIVVLNLVGLVALLSGLLYLNQFRAGLIESRTRSLLIQGEIIAGAIAASANVDTDTVTVDPDRLLQLQAGESLGLGEEISPLDFSINPEQVAPVLRRLVTPTRTRARIYDREGMLLLDSRNFYSRGDILRYDLPPAGQQPGVLQKIQDWLRGKIAPGPSPISEEINTAAGRVLPEVREALGGTAASVARINSQGETIVYVALPIQRLRTVRGALLLSTQGGDIDSIIASERWAMLRVFAVAAIVMTVLSVLLAGTIAGPVRRLAEAAERVRRGIKSRQEIPDFTARSDEIGHLSGALRDMTQALYRRIDAIESFAADVAHELKNPLTSLRSAVETLPLARNDDARDRLFAVIQQDVKRLDRLISDISDASRLDAELARIESEPIDVVLALETVAAVARGVHDNPIIITVDPDADPGRDFLVLGHDGRLGQVFNNLVDNAISFSPPDGEIRIDLRRDGNEVVVTVEDDGPGIPEHALERVFERFYTDRPAQKFGQNSGLGLSISRQIVEAHRGTIKAGNRTDADGEVTGACFEIRLPAMQPGA
ncbi:sensor histidine kinase [Pseudochelatococcus contaminans]|uniref:histidine kinase n=1 Tax=Pseudochelatococcus contaminans TaxID=1538103 RepID=A0A7W6EGU3_9HYPH|nr:sensor histidine kinase [Pseudochelatococcus contaminans]MBB3809661.1 two-component system sensor histidine kinase ChvG [Pseudochelatococcus contaminans]